MLTRDNVEQPHQCCDVRTLKLLQISHYIKYTLLCMLVNIELSCILVHTKNCFFYLCYDMNVYNRGSHAIWGLLTRAKKIQCRKVSTSSSKILPKSLVTGIHNTFYHHNTPTANRSCHKLYEIRNHAIFKV